MKKKNIERYGNSVVQYISVPVNIFQRLPIALIFNIDLSLGISYKIISDFKFGMVNLGTARLSFFLFKIFKFQRTYASNLYEGQRSRLPYPRQNPKTDIIYIISKSAE